MRVVPILLIIYMEKDVGGNPDINMRDLMRIKSNSKPADVYEVSQRDGVRLGKFSQSGQDLNCTPLRQLTRLGPIENDDGQLQNPVSDQSQLTHLWLFDTALLERAAARVMGACVTVFAPVALVWASNTGQTPETRRGCRFRFRLV